MRVFFSFFYCVKFLMVLNRCRQQLKCAISFLAAASVLGTVLPVAKTDWKVIDFMVVLGYVGAFCLILTHLAYV